ncbi:PIG-L family deacetylase [Streptomyces sp. NPDC014776]|uniref:PIG-L family deacetylase n=1 Tax=unclassified Streptomyces TaxID=2593676 RepID=UPI003701F697
MTADPLTAALDRGAPLVVLSPHLDDAVLSCGGLMAYARRRRVPVTVVSVFTEGSGPPYTLSGRRCLHLAGMGDARALYAARRAEDRAVLSDMGVQGRQLGLPEGLFRRKPGRDGRVSRLLPERDHVYPTYRGHLVAGRISPHDRDLLDRVTRAVTALATPDEPNDPDDRGSQAPPPLLLAPLAVGGHADHLLVREAVRRSGRPAVYYSDFPYNQRQDADPAFVRRRALCGPLVWTRNLHDKVDWILGYRTQARSLFPTGQVPLAPEHYLYPGDLP